MNTPMPAAHTTGPWEVATQPNALGRLHPRFWIKSPYGIIAETVNDATCEQKPNADLIAAAPDLLANLKELANLIELFKSGALVTWPASAIPCARMAIAKAEGRTL